MVWENVDKTCNPVECSLHAQSTLCHLSVLASMTIAHQASISGRIFPQYTAYQSHRRSCSAFNDIASCRVAGRPIYHHDRLASDTTIGESARASGIQQADGAAGRYHATRRQAFGAAFMCSSSAAASSEVRDGPLGCTLRHCMYFIDQHGPDAFSLLPGGSWFEV